MEGDVERNIVMKKKGNFVVSDTSVREEKAFSLKDFTDCK